MFIYLSFILVRANVTGVLHFFLGKDQTFLKEKHLSVLCTHVRQLLQPVLLAFPHSERILVKKFALFIQIMLKRKHIFLGIPDSRKKPFRSTRGAIFRYLITGGALSAKSQNEWW